MVMRNLCCAMLLAGSVVVAAPAASAAPDLWLEAEIEPVRVHARTQAIYRLRLYQGVAAGELKLSGPSAALADFRAVGDDRIYEALRDGRRYRVHERSYAVFPFASGELKIAGARADGVAAGGRRALRLDAAPRVLSVLPVPAGAGLPARELTLSESWSMPEQLAVGEVARRHVRIEAVGIDAAQLPELGFAIPGMAVHAEPARLENRFRGELNVASREQSFSIVPQVAGTLAVAELQLRWWNADAQAPAVAALPARTLAVAGASAPAVSATPVAAASSASIALIGALGLTAAWAWRRRAALSAAWRLRRACRSARPVAVRDGLLAWATLRWSDRPPRTLGALADLLDDEAARRALGELDRRLYGAGGADCDAAWLTGVVRQIRRAGRRRRPMVAE